MARKSARRLPWILETTNPVDTARCLIMQAGSVQAAHDCITRAHQEMQRKPAKYASALLLAAGIQRRDRCSDHKALTEAARLLKKGHTNQESFVRTLRRNLHDRPLAEFAAGYPDWAVTAPVIVSKFGQ